MNFLRINWHDISGHGAVMQCREVEIQTNIMWSVWLLVFVVVVRPRWFSQRLTPSVFGVIHSWLRTTVCTVHIYLAFLRITHARIRDFHILLFIRQCEGIGMNVRRMKLNKNHNRKEFRKMIANEIIKRSLNALCAASRNIIHSIYSFIYFRHNSCAWEREREMRTRGTARYKFNGKTNNLTDSAYNMSGGSAPCPCVATSEFIPSPGRTDEATRKRWDVETEVRENRENLIKKMERTNLWLLNLLRE